MDSAINTYSFLNSQLFNIDCLGNEMYITANASITLHASEQGTDHISISVEEGKQPRSYTYVVGDDASKIFSKI